MFVFSGESDNHCWSAFLNCEFVLPYFNLKLSALMHFGTKVNASSMGFKRSKFNVTLGFNMLQNALLALLMHYLENYSTEFLLTFNNNASWDEDECFSVWGQKIKGQGHSMRHTELDVVCRVLISELMRNISPSLFWCCWLDDKNGIQPVKVLVQHVSK